MDLFIDFLNNKIRIRTNSRLYADYLKAYFQPLVCGDKDPGAALALDILWAKDQWKEVTRSVVADDMVQIGGHTFVSPRKTVGVFKDKKKILYGWDQNETMLSHQAIIRDVAPDAWWMRWHGGNSGDQYFYETTLRGVYYPLFCYLRRKEEKLVLHASAVDRHGEGVAFCGLDGVGKSCIALHLSQQPGTSFISDNLIFADRQNIYPCHELIRLHPRSASWLDPSRLVRWNKASCMKDFYTPVRSPDKKGTRLKKLIFSGFHPTNRVARISAREAVHRLTHLNRLAGELSDYPRAHSLYSLLKGPEASSDEAILGSLLAGAECFNVQFDRSNDLETNMKFLTQEIGLS